MLDQLIYFYSSVCPNDKIYTLGEIFNYYYANEINSKILSRNLIKYDIKSAFPNICKLMFGSDSEFVQKLFSITDKFERNVFLTNSLKDKERKYLLEFNNYSKMIVLGAINNFYNDVVILEYQKDGVLFKGTESHVKNIEFKKFLDENFMFHIDKIDIYIRFNKTSMYAINSELDFKGYYKNIPTFLNQTIKQIVFKNKYESLENIKQIYSMQYFQILKELKMFNEIHKYYDFENKYLNKNGEKINNLNECYPSSILKYILYPILTLIRSEI